MNPFWGLGGFLVGIIAIILAVIFFRRGQRTKKPTFYIRSSNLIADFSSKLAKLQILYSSKGIESLTVSKIAFWNDGAQTIDSRDVAQADPLRIVLKEGYEILDVSVISIKNEANRFDVVQLEEGSSVKISFDYLDKHEGGVIQLIHTGKGSSDIEVLGIVKGVGKPRPRYYRPAAFEILDRLLPTSKFSKAQPLRARRLMGISGLVAAIVMVIVAITAEELLTTIFGSILALLYGYMGYTSFKRRIPSGFEIVEEEI
jgi:hypothetical protein